MINNESNKAEHFEPQDSERKDIRHPEDDEKAVLKPEDQDYHKKEANLRDPEKRKVESEQPINSIDEKPNKLGTADSV